MTERNIESRMAPRSARMPWISWGAVFGGLVSGLASFFLLTLLGLAAGVTAMTPDTAQPVGAVPAATGIWTGVSLLISAFIGGYVAARLSGLARRSDGLFHGFVVWGASTLLLIYLVTTSLGSLLGGLSSLLGQGLQTTASVASSAMSGENPLQSLIGAAVGDGVELSPQMLENLQNQLDAGNRQGAMNTLVNQVGINPDLASLLVNQAMSLQGVLQQIPSAQAIAGSAVSGLTAATWWLFVGMLLSLVLGMAGGILGSRGVGKRRAITTH